MKNKKALGISLIITPLLSLGIFGYVFVKPTLKEILYFILIMVVSFIFSIMISLGSDLINKGDDNE